MDEMYGMLANVQKCGSKTETETLLRGEERETLILPLDCVATRLHIVKKFQRRHDFRNVKK